MSEDFRENGHARRPEDVAVERLPADLEAIYDRLARDGEGWARRMPEALSLQGYLRALAAGTATVEAADLPEDSAAGLGDEDNLFATGPAAPATERQAPGAHTRPSRRAVWGGAVSAVAIVALLAGAFALIPRMRGAAGLTVPTATATPQAPSCAPEQITVTLPAHALLYQIAMTSPTDGWALGESVTQVDQAEQFNPVLVRFRDCRWTAVPSPLPGADAHLNDISMATAEDGWAAGWESSSRDTPAHCVLLHYTGGGWRRAPLPPAIPEQQSACNKILMVSPDEGWLLATSWGTAPSATHLLHYVNGAWTLVDIPVSGAFGLAATGPDDVWVAGTRAPADSDPNRMMLADMAHYQQGRWTTFHLSVGAQDWLRMNSPSDGWLVSAPLPQQVLHYDGAAWQQSPFTDHAPTDGSITVFDSGDAWAIATTAAEYPKVTSMQHYVGGQWQSVQWPFTDDMVFTPLTRVAPGEYWAVGVHPADGGVATRTWVLLHYVGGAWHEYGA